MPLPKNARECTNDSGKYGLMFVTHCEKRQQTGCYAKIACAHAKGGCNARII
jgi:hypothetical protein